MSHRHRLAVPVIALVLCACTSSAATGVTSLPMTLTFEPATQRLVGTRTPDGNLRCEVDLTIQAHGASDHLLTLQNVSAKFTIGEVSNVPAIIAPYMWFGVSTLKRDQSAVTHRQPTAPGPFTFTSTLTYKDQFGTMQTATSTVECTG